METEHLTFEGLGIIPEILTLLEKHKLQTPTPIQLQAIPSGVAGKDIVGIAQTGTGKTFAFGIPLVQRLFQSPGRALILAPTRELAYQIAESLERLARPLHIGIAVFVGGASMEKQRGDLRRNPRILVATPGRLNDHLERRTVSLKEVNVLVLDEADMMLDMGFKPQIDRVLSYVPMERQTMLFSATMPKEILQLAQTQMRLPLKIEVAPPGTGASTVSHELFMVQKDQKLSLLAHLLTEETGSVLVFSRTKHGAKRIMQQVKALGHAAAEIHSNRSLAQRREALEGFKRGTYRVLVATDIASRGIHVTNIAMVVNYDLPAAPDDYVHRSGRTGRAGREGRSIAFATPDQVRDIRDIERLMRKPLPRGALPAHLPKPNISLPPETFEGFRPRRPSGGGGNRFGGGRSGGGRSSSGGGRRFSR